MVRPGKSSTPIPPIALRVIAALGVLASLWISPRTSFGTVVRFQTNVGNIDVRLYDAATPLSVANFLNYVTTDRYDGTFIHRVPQKMLPDQSTVTSDFVVQGGGFLLNNSIFAAEGIVTDDPVMNEPGISNLRGTISYAKGADPNSATSQWFFNISDNIFLDSPDKGAFTAFGRVVRNTMNVVDLINDLPTVNASAAETPLTAEDFDEVPVLDLAQVINQNDITSADAVMILNIYVRNTPPGDYNFNGVVTALDLPIWEADFGSHLKADADGNGNGVVDGKDFLLWQRNFDPNSGFPVSTVPEPHSIGLSAFAILLTAALRRCWRAIQLNAI